MKNFLFVFVVLLSLVFAPLFDTHNAYAENTAPRLLKQSVLSDLQSLDTDNKKDQKRILKAIKNTEKSLKDKFWIDDSSLSLLGKKVFSNDKKSVKELSKIKSVNVSNLIDDILISDMLLAQSAIDELPTDTDNKKLNKILEKSLKEMDKAQKDLEKNKFEKSISHYKKAWKLAIMGEGIDVAEIDSASLDYSNDGIADYYVQLEYTGDPEQPTKLGYKIQDECVDLGPKDPSDVGGDTYDDASMLIGVSTVSKQWLVDDMVVWNDWFKKKNNDENKMVDLIFSPTRTLPHFEDLEGDNVIQGGNKKFSFGHSESISLLSGQSGWKGSLYFNAPSGDYLLWTVHPSGGIDECDRLTALGVPITIP